VRFAPHPSNTPFPSYFALMSDVTDMETPSATTWRAVITLHDDIADWIEDNIRFTGALTISKESTSTSISVGSRTQTIVTTPKPKSELARP